LRRQHDKALLEKRSLEREKSLVEQGDSTQAEAFKTKTRREAVQRVLTTSFNLLRW
jgi:hypothetical protein